jgi:hypothetical protein
MTPLITFALVALGHLVAGSIAYRILRWLHLRDFDLTREDRRFLLSYSLIFGYLVLLVVPLLVAFTGTFDKDREVLARRRRT